MNTPQPEPRLFHLVRPAGASPGAGPRASTGAAGLVPLTGAEGREGFVTVAEGVEWSDGTVTLRWRGQWPATSVWEGGIDAILAVHAGNGATELRWRPASPAPPDATGAPASSAPASVPSPVDTAACGLRLAAPGVDGRCVSCGLVWPCLSCGP